MKNSFFSHYFENIPKTSGLYGDYNKHRQKMKIKEKRQLMSSMQTPSVVVPPVTHHQRKKLHSHKRKAFFWLPYYSTKKRENVES